MTTSRDDDRRLLDGHDVAAEGIDDWRLLFYRLHARFETGDFATGVRLVDAIGALADAADHHPDVDLAFAHVDVRLSSHDVGGVTQRDVRLAREIAAAAAHLGATPRPDQVSVLELALDTADFAEVKPFWAALLGYVSNPHSDAELNDPDGTMPSIWAQATQPHEAPRQRWHLDLRVPPEVAEARVRAALAAGGTLVSAEHAPAFWVLADRQGNQACVTTWHGRD
jgi:4a-hydroxytetrahydrobiopterin dehydratase